jgi:hypothetical protein
MANPRLPHNGGEDHENGNPVGCSRTADAADVVMRRRRRAEKLAEQMAVQQAVNQAYRKGAADAVRQIQIQAEQGKQKLMQQIQPTLLIGAIMVLLVTFYGDVIAERFREKLVKKLELTPARQAMLLTVGYFVICLALAGWSLQRCGAEWSFPVLLLLTGATGVFFVGYLPALFKVEEREARRLALSKIKLMMFAACVILAVHELLASDGLLRLPM